MADRKDLSKLTKAIMVGASIGTVGLVQVGMPALQASAQTTAGTSESALVDRALQSGSAADINRLMETFPTSTAIAPLLSSLPSSSLRALSPSAVTRLSSSVRRDLPFRVRANLPGFIEQGGFGRVTDDANDSTGSSDPGGGY